jgi:hypothetical protein
MAIIKVACKAAVLLVRDGADKDLRVLATRLVWFHSRKAEKLQTHSTFFHAPAHFVRLTDKRIYYEIAWIIVIQWHPEVVPDSAGAPGEGAHLAGEEEEGEKPWLDNRGVPDLIMHVWQKRSTFTDDFLGEMRFSIFRFYADQNSESESEAGSASEAESNVMGVDSDEEDEEEVKPPAQPYMSLMRSLVESAPHKAKRRKLDHTASEHKETSQAGQAPEPVKDEENEETRDVDLVEEPEEDPTAAPPEDLFDEDDDLDSSDPFEVHFSEPKEEELQPRLKAIQASKWRTERIATKSTRVFLNTPDTGDAEGKSLPAPMSAISDLKLKKRLQETMASKHPKFDQVEQTIAPHLFNYQDILYCNRTVSGSQGIRRMACLHALNHIYKYAHRDKISKSNTLTTAEHATGSSKTTPGWPEPRTMRTWS